ncbi:MAG: glycosyltransferase [Paludibacter sp.]|jgi:glycosyltransferase involved in cell wall biosynthesis|nr:glycosyltransferase [Paludibacter sp.]
MNILFLTSWYPTDDMPHAGLFVKEHACAIHKAGNNIIVVALIVKPSDKIFNTEIKDFVDEHGMSTQIIYFHTKYYNLVHYCLPLQLFYLGRLVKRTNYKFDIVHSNVIFPSGVLGHLIAKKLHIPHIITEHWSRINRIMKMPVFSGLCKHAYIKSRKILPVSAYLKHNIQSQIPGLHSDKFQIIGNIVNPDLFKYTEKKTHKLNNISFCAIATWATKKTPDKLPELFIEALSILKNELKIDITLTMIGGGDRIDELKNLCRTSGLNAKFTNHIEKQRIASLLQQSDFFLHASTIETFSIVVAEALYCGTPVICSNVGALPELVNESNGVLCVNTVDAWVNGIKKALTTSYNHKSISESIDKRFNYVSIGVQINEIYSQLKH